MELSIDSLIIKGHKKCSEYITQSVANLLETPYNFCATSQNVLLNEVEPVFTEEDNEKMLEIPNKSEIYDILKDSNLHAAPGNDCITSYFYYKLFDIIGSTLTRIVQHLSVD